MKLQPVRGMRDFLPERMGRKQAIEDAVRETFEKYGFEPMQTPALEDFGVLSAKGGAGEAIKDEIYYFRDKSNRELGMRFDLTVPLARVAASNPQLPKPFKRYAIERVWRYDRPGSQRYREFTQADADILGSSSILSDFEIIALAVDFMRKTGLEFCIKINDRRLLEEIALKSGVEREEVGECLRSLDKLNKIGEKAVEAELGAKGIKTRILGQLSVQFKEFGDLESAAPLKELLAMLKENGIEKYVKVDLSLARGLEYYTGIVFEVCALKGPSVGGGGRYDRLVEVFGGGKTPAVGISFGIDRILDLGEGKIEPEKITKIFVIPISEEFAGQAMKLTQKIRALGMGAATDLVGRNLSKNMEYANREGIPFIIVLGENELKAKEFRLKEMATGKETAIQLDRPEELKKLVK